MTVDKALKQLQRSVKNLEAVMAKEYNKAAQCSEMAKKLEEDSKASANEAERAARIKKKIEELME